MVLWVKYFASLAVVKILLTPPPTRSSILSYMVRVVWYSFNSPGSIMHGFVVWCGVRILPSWIPQNYCRQSKTLYLPVLLGGLSRQILGEWFGRSLTVWASFLAWQRIWPLQTAVLCTWRTVVQHDGMAHSSPSLLQLDHLWMPACTHLLTKHPTCCGYLSKRWNILMIIFAC